MATPKEAKTIDNSPPFARTLLNTSMSIKMAETAVMAIDTKIANVSAQVRLSGPMALLNGG